MMTREEHLRLMKMLTLLRKSFPNSKADSETLALYVEALDDMPIDAVHAGIIKTMQTSHFFPTVAEIREAAESIVREINHSDEPTAGEAWDEVMRWLQRNSPYSDKKTPWKHKNVELAAKRFGLMSFYELKADDVNIARAQFRNLYNQIVNKEKGRKEAQQVMARLGERAAALIAASAEKHKMIG